MASIRTVGSPSPHQPVRFYKFVALTFLVITIVLLGMIVFMSSKRADITIVTRSESVDMRASLDISDGSSGPVAGFVTSTFVDMSRVFSPEGSRTEDGTSEGLITIMNETNAAQPLVIKTRFITEDGTLFRLKEGVVVPANGSITTEVYADQPGSASDIPPSDFTIPGLNEAKQKVIYGKSNSPMSGGVRTIGILSKDDIERAQQVLLADLKKKGSEQLDNKSQEYDGVLYKVAQYTFEHDSELGVETDGFLLTGKATVVGVFYDKAELDAYAREMLEKQVVDNSEILKSVESEPVVVVEDYNLESNTASLGITHTGLVSIDQNSKELQKLMFYGKTEDEVRRYVMSLDHVQEVEMNFRPLWNRSVPHVASHVKITVREIE